MMQKIYTLIVSAFVTIFHSQVFANNNVPIPHNSKYQHTGKKIILATEGQYKPFNYIDEDGQLAGFDVDIANALCTEMQADCEIVPQDWDGIISGLMADKFDAIIAGMSITEERSKHVRFSLPYYEEKLLFLANKQSKFNPDNSLRANSSYKVGVQSSTFPDNFITENKPQFKNVTRYNSKEDVLSALNKNSIDAAFMYFSQASLILKTNTNLEKKGSSVAIEDKIGIATRLEDSLVTDFNTALLTIKKNGVYNAIYDRYFKVR